MADVVRNIGDGSVPAPVAAAQGWLVGFHGVLRSDDLGAAGSSSLRALALGNRSLGVQRMHVLTALPGAAAARTAPRSTNGQRPLGAGTPASSAHPAPPADAAPAPSGSPASPAPPAPSAPPASRPDTAWDPAREELPDYLERRLLTARFLYLPNRSRSYRVVKRVLDVVGAALLLVLTAPVLLVLAVLIRIDSPGPAVFRQQRVTRGGEVFTFYKFRTMWVDARERYPSLYDYGSSGPFTDVYYKLEDDPRNTRVGRWLRRTTLDELPNLVNVLRGEMSLVGPRPELPELLAHYDPEDLALFFTKAGLTGLAQVAGRSLLTVRERLTLDLRYVAQQTILLDLRILWRTLACVLGSRGAF